MDTSETFRISGLVLNNPEIGRLSAIMALVQVYKKRDHNSTDYPARHSN